MTVINRSGGHLLQLINEILEMSRIEAGRASCDAEDFDLHQLLENLHSLFLMRARDKGLTLTVVMIPDLPRFIRSDQRKLRQILFNLLGNAVKFTRAGTVRIDATGRAGRLELTVVDTGPGIAADDLPRLFQPFMQTQVGQRTGEGSGLGLALSRGFAQVLGGEITVVSQVGQGSTFTLSLPLVVAEKADRQPMPERQVMGLAPGYPPLQILVADDHADSRTLMASLLEAGGCMVTTVGDGAAAVAACRSQRHDLVWMDIDMPALDGLAAAKAIRALPGPPPMIVACTAAAFELDRLHMLANGCDDVLAKPYREDQIFLLMERLLHVRFVWKEARQQ